MANWWAYQKDEMTRTLLRETVTWEATRDPDGHYCWSDRCPQGSDGLEDVIRMVHEEGDIARVERVIGEERVEVGTRDDLNLAAGAVKVGDHRGSVDNLVVGQVDIPSHFTGVGRRNAKDDWNRMGRSLAASRI